MKALSLSRPTERLLMLRSNYLLTARRFPVFNGEKREGARTKTKTALSLSLSPHVLALAPLSHCASHKSGKEVKDDP